MKRAARSVPEDRSQPWRAGALILGAVLLCYLPVWQAGFIWDDKTLITHNLQIHAADGLRAIWFSTQPVDYWPLTYSTFWLEWRLWGLNATGYHVTNVLLHAGGAVLLWRVLLRLKIPGAWFAALIFAVHPVNVESVAWITERKNTLSMLFCLLAVLWYLRFDTESRNRKWYWLSLAAFALSLLAKTGVVLLPFVLLLCVWWRNQRLGGPDFKRVAPFFVVAVALGAATLWFQTHRAIAGDTVRADSFASRLAGAGWAIWFYLYKALAPLNLAFVYPRWQINPASLLTWLPLAGWLAGFGLFWKYRRSWGRAALFGFGGFLLMLLPVLGFLNIYFFRYSLVADHWQYFALPFVIALATGGGIILFQRRQIQIWNGRIAAAIIVVALGVLSWNQTHHYRTEESLWRATLKKNPAAGVALDNLGSVLFNAGRIDEAVGYWQEAIEKNPNDADAYNNVGNAFFRTGQRDAGIMKLKRALEINPRHAGAHNNLGFAYFNLGRTDEAIAHFRQAVEIRPDYAEAHYNLGGAAFKLGRDAEAVSHLQRAIAINPFNAPARDTLAKALVAVGRTDEAIAHWKKAIQLNPRSVSERNSLAWVLATFPVASSRNGAEAVTLAEQSIQLAGGPNPQLLGTLAAAYAEAGQLTNAMQTARRALQFCAEQNQPALAEKLRYELRSYEAGAPYRDQALSPAPAPKNP